ALCDGGGWNGPAVVRTIRLRRDRSVKRAGVVARRGVGSVSPGCSRYIAGVRVGCAHAHRPAAHLGGTQRGSNLGSRQPSSRLCVRPDRLRPVVDRASRPRPNTATAAAERRAFAGLVSTAFGGYFFHPLIGETG